ncbi:hypothetical protein SAMD00023353_1600230 [Rosellinia necatrix]|uniref:Uncharacterized protein n=1 Tax=Rosellinia necatrix TaxID=77044 RepID=A0A1W2TKM2_ROSNE|nr:hypothetical protein SAMD00023353_1600230 [Rosellinia necatrix]
MSCNGSKEYKPYTTPYTGTGAVKTEQGWVNSRDLGAPGAASGPGNRRDSCPPVPSFHHAELTTTNVAPPSGHKDAENTASQSRRQSLNLGIRASRSRPIIPSDDEIKEIKGPDGLGYDLPKYHGDLSSMSNREIALKISLLHLKKGNIHEDMHQAATNRDILSREPHEQFKFRSENARNLSEVEEAIRAWEGVQAARAENTPNPGLVDMLMISQDYYERERSRDEQSDPGCDPSSSRGPDPEGKEGEKRVGRGSTG